MVCSKHTHTETPVITRPPPTLEPGERFPAFGDHHSSAFASPHDDHRDGSSFSQHDLFPPHGPHSSSNSIVFPFHQPDQPSRPFDQHAVMSNSPATQFSPDSGDADGVDGRGGKRSHQHRGHHHHHHQHQQAPEPSDSHASASIEHFRSGHTTPSSPFRSVHGNRTVEQQRTPQEADLRLLSDQDGRRSMAPQLQCTDETGLAAATVATTSGVASHIAQSIRQSSYIVSREERNRSHTHSVCNVCFVLCLFVCVRVRSFI